MSIRSLLPACRRIARTQLVLFAFASPFLIGLCCTAYGALAQVSELSASAIDSLLSVEAGRSDVRVNGELFRFAVDATERSPTEVVDAFERRCASDGADLAGELGPLLERAEARDAGQSHVQPARMLTLSQASHGSDASARSVCFTKRGAVGSLFERLTRLAQTGQLAELGGLELVQADRDETTGVTRVLTVSSEGRLDIAKSFPGRGDAGGDDPLLAPRPAQSVRLFSARVLGAEQGAYIYESKLAADALLLSLDAALTGHGFVRVELAPTRTGDERTASYVRADSLVVALLTPGRELKTSLLLVERTQAATRAAQP